MARLKLDAVAVERPEVIDLSDAAFRLWISMLCWSQYWGKDGAVPVGFVKRNCGRRWKRLLAEIVDGGLAWPIEGQDRWYELARSARGFELWRPSTTDDRPTRPAIPASLRAAVYDRDGHACLHCGATTALSLDHVWPYSRGGEDTYDNLQTLCRRCNSRKGASV